MSGGWRLASQHARAAARAQCEAAAPRPRRALLLPGPPSAASGMGCLPAAWLRCAGVVPVSIGMSLMGAWASMYHLVAKWESAEHGGAWGCNLLQN